MATKTWTPTNDELAAEMRAEAENIEAHADGLNSDRRAALSGRYGQAHVWRKQARELRAKADALEAQGKS